MHYYILDLGQTISDMAVETILHSVSSRVGKRGSYMWEFSRSIDFLWDPVYMRKVKINKNELGLGNKFSQ